MVFDGVDDEVVVVFDVVVVALVDVAVMAVMFECGLGSGGVIGCVFRRVGSWTWC